MLNSIHKKKIVADKNGDKEGKVLYKLKSNAVNQKAMEKVTKRIYVKLSSDKKDYLKWAFKLGYMPNKIFDNDLVAIRKNKVTFNA